MKNRPQLRRMVILALLISIAGWSVVPAHATDNDLTTTGDILAVALPLAAFGGTYLYDDPEGRSQFLKSIITSTTTVYLMKEAISKIRPGDWSELEGKSYPSGHSQAVFSGASFIYTRYGWKWGVPAYLLAALGAYSRVDAQAHYLDDVTIGASIAMLTNWYFTTSYAEQVGITPILGDGRYGASVSIPMQSKPAAYFNDHALPKWKFSLHLGPSWPVTAEAVAPSSQGSTVDLTEFDDDFVPNGYAGVTRYFGDRHDIYFKMMPLEYRFNGVFSQDQLFDGVVFPAGESSRIRYRLNEWHLRYRYELFPKEPFDLKVGLGLGYFDAKVEITNASGLEGSADEWNLLPMAHLYLGYQFNPKWWISAETDFFYMKDNWHDEFRALVHYRIDPNWELSGGYRFWAGEVEESDLEYKYAYQGMTLGISYLFY